MLTLEEADHLASISEPTIQSVESILLSLNKWPTQMRPNVSPNGSSVDGMCFGLVYGLGGQGLKVSCIAQKYTNLTKLISKACSGSIPGGFEFTSIQINHNYASKKHCDSNNAGPSWIISLGDHTGGGLWTQDGILYPHNQWCTFNGCNEHATEPFEGTRISIICFVHNACHELSECLSSELRELGFIGDSSRYRHLGKIDTRAFLREWETLPEVEPMHVVVQCAGYECCKGRARVITNLDKIAVHEFEPNRTGIHFVEIGGDLTKRKVARFDFYKDMQNALEKMQKTFEKIHGDSIVVLSVSDSAIAKSRPLVDQVYGLLYEYGCPEIPPIGYRAPFVAILKRGHAGIAAYNNHSQSKSIVCATASFDMSNLYTSEIMAPTACSL